MGGFHIVNKAGVFLLFFFKLAVLNDKVRQFSFSEEIFWCIMYVCCMYMFCLWEGFAGKVTLVTTSGVSFLSSSLPPPLYSEIPFINSVQQASLSSFLFPCQLSSLQVMQFIIYKSEGSYASAFSSVNIQLI